MPSVAFRSLFFCLDPTPTQINTLSLHDALPISAKDAIRGPGIHNWDLSLFKNMKWGRESARRIQLRGEFYNAFNHAQLDRKSTRLNSSHLGISYAVFCLKKKKGCHQIQSPLYLK